VNGHLEGMQLPVKPIERSDARCWVVRMVRQRGPASLGVYAAWHDALPGGGLGQGWLGRVTTRPTAMMSGLVMKGLTLWICATVVLCVVAIRPSVSPALTVYLLVHPVGAGAGKW
jgi:hypothetical protein